MQSVRQYYQFRRSARTQWERDVQKAETLRRANQEARAGEKEAQAGSDQESPAIQSSSSSHSTKVTDTGRPSSITSSVHAADRLPRNEKENDGDHTEKFDRLQGPTREDRAQQQEAIEEIGMSPEDEVREEPPTEDDFAELGRLGSPLRHAKTTDSDESFGVTLGNILTGIEVRQISRVKSRRSFVSRTRSHAEGEVQRKDEHDTVFVVGFDGPDDPMKPQNWSAVSRAIYTLMISLIALIVGFASSADSMISSKAAAEFHVSEVVEAMAVGLFLVGFGVGALYAGPISETVGRNPVYITTMALYMLFIMASGLAPNIGAQIPLRFFAGFFAATPLTCAGGSISDMWTPIDRVYAFPLFAFGGFFGPVLGPIVGGFIAQSDISWRWCEWVTLIASGAILFVLVLIQPETYPPVLLKYKAHHLRQITGDERFVAEVEIRADSLAKRILLALYRPFVLLVQEPIIIVFALYLTIVYIILFTFLSGFDFIFADTYGFSPGLTGLCFVAIGIGLFLTVCLVPFVASRAKRDLQRLERRRYELEEERQHRLEEGDLEANLPPVNSEQLRLAPEERLWYAMLGAPAIPVSIFWMGWTTNPNISFWSPLAAAVMFGFGTLCVFISTYQYLIDTYELYAASALAAVSVIRYVASGGMAEVGIPFYENMGVHYTLTILGSLSVLMVPVPYVLYRFGPKVRGWSKYSA